MEEFIKYLKEVRAELKKVTWTGWKEVRTGAFAVLILCTAISAFLWIVDIGLSQVVRLIVKSAGSF